MLTFSNMHKTTLIALLIACSFTAAAKDAVTVDSRIAAQNALFEEEFQADLKAHPERATAIGDYRYNDQLEDYSPAAFQRQDAADRKFLARLNAIPTTGFPEQDKLSHEVMERSLTQRIANFKFKEYEMPVNHMEGPQVRFTDMPLAVPLDSVRHYEDYIARLHQIPRAFAQIRRDPARGNEGQAHAGALSSREGAGAMRRHHRLKPFSDSDEEVSGQLFRRGPAAPDEGD